MIGRIRRAKTSRLVPAVAGLLLGLAAITAAAPALTSGADPPPDPPPGMETAARDVLGQFLARDWPASS